MTMLVVGVEKVMSASGVQYLLTTWETLARSSVPTVPQLAETSALKLL